MTYLTMNDNFLDFFSCENSSNCKFRFDMNIPERHYLEIFKHNQILN